MLAVAVIIQAVGSGCNQVEVDERVALTGLGAEYRDFGLHL